MDRTVSLSAYPPRIRLRRPEEFKCTILKGKRIRSGGGHFDLKYLSNTLGSARLGCVVPKRLAPLAVHRNRLKRLAREAFRIRQSRLRPGNIVFRQISKIADPRDPAIREEIEALFQSVVDV